MQVKVCPSCSTENRPTNAACYKCRTPLADVEATEGQGTALSQSTASRTTQPAKTAAAPTISTPPSAPEQTQYAPIPPQAPSNQRYVPQAPQYRSAPVTVNTSLPPGIIALIVMVVLGSLTYAFIKAPKPSPKPTEAPEKVVAAFLEAKKTHKIAKVKPYLSKQSIETLDNFLSSRQAQSAGFTRKDAEDMFIWNMPPSSEDLANSIISLSVVRNKNDAENTAVIHALFTPKTKSLLAFNQSFEYVLIAEEGKWKVDVSLSQARTMDNTGSMQQFMPKPPK